MPSTHELSPQERLALTRKAIVRHMNRDRPVDLNDDTSNPYQTEPGRDGLLGAWDTAMHAVLAWWHRHPASAVLELTRPFMSDYAVSHPFKLLGFSAGIGSALVLVKPWRMMSLGSWLVAGVKSSGVVSVVVSLLSRPRRKSETNYRSNRS